MVKIANPPLKRFSLRITFSDIQYPTIHELSAISNELSSEYPEPALIKLISSKGPETELFFSPLRFVSNKGDNEIAIFRDAIIFSYTEKYTTWEDIVPKLESNFFYLAEKLGISIVNAISIDYLDVFDNISIEEFSLKAYFNIDLITPPTMRMDYDDFTIGIKIKIEPGQNAIMRLRGIPNKTPDNKYYIIQLENHFHNSIPIDLIDRKPFMQVINKGHEILANNFKSVLTDKTKKLIGM